MMRLGKRPFSHYFLAIRLALGAYYCSHALVMSAGRSKIGAIRPLGPRSSPPPGRIILGIAACNPTDDLRPFRAGSSVFFEFDARVMGTLVRMRVLRARVATLTDPARSIADAE